MRLRLWKRKTGPGTRGGKPRFLILPGKARQYGGPLSFSTRLRAYLEANGFEEHDRIDSRLDVILVFVKAPLRDLIKARALGIPILLRLDGLYYPRKAGWLNIEYLRVNLIVFLIRMFLCDFVIYQSAYSKRMCDRLIGPVRKRYRIIHNGVPGLAYPPPDRPPAGGGPFRFVAIGNFRGKDMLPATLAALDRVRAPEAFTLDVYGRLDAESKACLDRPYVRHRGEADPRDIVGILAGYDAMIFTQLCPSCSNTVIEAVAASLPVIAYDSGSVRELLSFNAALIAPAGGLFFQGVSDFDPGPLAACIEAFLRDPGSYRREARLHANDFEVEEKLSGYRDVLRGILRMSPEVAPGRETAASGSGTGPAQGPSNRTR